MRLARSLARIVAPLPPLADLIGDVVATGIERIGRVPRAGLATP